MENSILYSGEKERIAYLDLLRVISAFLVIFLHAAAVFCVHGYPTRSWHLIAFCQMVSRIGVPLFIMVSGALFLNPQKNITFENLFKKYIPRLGLVFVFWWVVYEFVDFWLKGTPLSLSGFLDPKVHLWFLPMLIGLYLLVPILRVLVQNQRLTEYFLSVWVIITLLNDIPMSSHLLDWSHFPVISNNVGYFVLGYYLTGVKYSERFFRTALGLAIICIIVDFGLIEWLTLQNGSATSKILATTSVFKILPSAIVFLIAKKYAGRVGKKTGMVIRYLQGDMLGVYLIHMLWLMLLRKMLIFHLTSSIISIPLMSVIGFALSIASIELLRRIPLIKKLVN